MVPHSPLQLRFPQRFLGHLNTRILQFRILFSFFRHFVLASFSILLSHAQWTHLCKDHAFTFSIQCYGRVYLFILSLRPPVGLTAQSGLAGNYFGETEKARREEWMYDRSDEQRKGDLVNP